MKISIITATFNSGKTLRDTLDSVLRQDYHNYELIIKDGGSKDDTLAICKEYEQKFQEVSRDTRRSNGFHSLTADTKIQKDPTESAKRGSLNQQSVELGTAVGPESLEPGTAVGPTLRVISCPDHGIYDAMNQGIAAATGDVVGLLNSDDFYTSSDILSTIAEEFDRYPDIDAIYGDVHYVREDDTTRLTRYYSSKHFSRFWMRLGFMPAHPSFYCRKSTYESFKLPAERVKGLMSKVKGQGSGDYRPVTEDMYAADNFYFNPSYKIAADFENLLRMIFVNRIKTHYVNRDFVTMRTGGASSSGTSSHKQINKDHRRAFKENGVYSNYFLLSLRYCYKVVEVILGRIKR